MTDFTLTRTDEGIAIIRFDAQGRTMNTLTAVAWDELAALIDTVTRESSIKGAVITSGKSNGFCAGADLDELIGFAGNTPVSEVEKQHRFDFLFKGNKVARQIETCGKPVAAAINGLALGGGLELALACHHRVLADDIKARIGLPEASIGLLPGGGGTQRVTRLLGVAGAMPLLVNGNTLTPQAALKLGLVDAVVPAGTEIDAAVAWINQVGDPVARWDRPGFTLPGGVPDRDAGADAVASAAAISADMMANTPALHHIVHAVFEAAALPMDEAIRVETDHFLKTLQSPQAKAMIRTQFRSYPALKKGPERSVDTPPVRKVAVLGAGMMGAGIAYSFAKSGIETILVDVSEAAAAQGKAYSEKLVARLVPKGILSQEQADSLLANIRPTSDYGNVAGADLLVETVFEDIAVKAEATGKALAHLPKDILVASNTSTLPISRLAEAHATPENFIGMHFHSPVDRMELVEVVSGKRTSPAAVEHARAIVRQIGKTAILANDSPFFYTSRVFDTYIREGMEMLVDGFAPELIDRVGKMTGMPRGPLELTDDVAIDLIGRIAGQRKLMLGDAATRRRSDDVVDLLLGEDRLGRKNGKGFYDYAADGSKQVWDGLTRNWPVRTTQADNAVLTEMRHRLLHRQAVEAARCLAENVLEDPRHADVGAILGWSFPKWTGGPVSYIEQIGIQAFVEQCDALATRWGERFAPPEMLRRMAASGETFYDGLIPQWKAA